MSSLSYDRAKAMVLADKYNSVKEQFNSDLAALVNRYFVVDSIVSDVIDCDQLQIAVTLSVKKVKELKQA